MKGVILAGGLATRLWPLTLVTNKHLLPVYDKPMIYYPLESMLKAGIKEVLITSASKSVGQFADLLGSGEEWNMKLYYVVQKNPKGGIADGIALAEEFAKNESILVILGDNIFNYDLKYDVENFDINGGGAMIYGFRTNTASGQYGVIEPDPKDKYKVLSIAEKPKNPKSDIAQTGIYMYDLKVFDYIKKLQPSPRGELEVTDLNNMYLFEDKLLYGVIDWWIDAGSSHDELLKANQMVAEKVKNGEL
jgi:glucose-1-phosphate thymidylyltransferase